MENESNVTKIQCGKDRESETHRMNVILDFPFRYLNISKKLIRIETVV
jgi:hypothetical protein